MSDSDITAELKRVGLDHPPGYWSKVFQDELGVTSVEALGLVGGDSYHILKRFVNHPWEKKALRTLLDIKEEESAFKKQRESQLEKMNERYKKASELLKMLKEERSECKDRNDQTVKDLENAAREMLQVSPAAWISKEESLSELITHLERLQDGIGSQLKKKGDVEDITVLKTASGGRALLGVIHSKNLEDQLSVPENYLLKIPESVQLLSASHSQKDITEQFSSQHQEDCFSKTVDVLGYSVAVAAKASGFWGVTVEGSVAVSRKTSEEKTSEQHEQQQYCSTMKYSFMPLASFAFTDSQLQLSEDALGDLKYIEEVLVTYTPESPNTQLACKNFFKKFGSHANRGPLHFGGIYWLKCSTKAFKHSETTVLKQLQYDAVNVQVSISHIIGVGASSEVDVTSVKEKYNGRCLKSTMSQTVMQLEKTGGPPEASTLPEWKSGLVASNSTWNLIDRGTNFVPVWEIIRMNHSKQFGKVRELIDVLKKTWEKMTNENAEPDFETPSYSCTDVMKEVTTWNPKEDASDLKEKLEYLIEVKEDLIKVSINPQAWSSLYLSQEPLQHFLKSVVEQQQSTGAEKAHIKLLMTQLVEKADLNRLKLTNFPCKVLSQWMYGKIAQPQSLLPLECSDFLSFKKYLEAALEAMNEAKARSMPTGFIPSRSAPQDSYISIATSAVGKAVNSFERSLQECNQRYEHLFLLTMLYPFKYGTSYQPVILKQMSPSDLQYLTELLQAKCDDFFKVKCKSLTKTQVFLFHLTIEICLNGSQIDMDEHLALKHLKYLEKKIGEDLESPVQDMLTKFYSSSDVDLEELQIELYAALSSKDIHQQETGPSLMSVLDSVKKTQEDQSTMNTSVNQSAAKECNNPGAAHLFHILDLMQSYPQKLTLHDALSIRKDTLGNVECNDPSRVYMFLLQKIMAYDCQCRSNILQEENVLTTSSEKDELFGDDFEDEDIQGPESTIKVHPMDSLLALILCADDFLRHDLLARLVDCQLSIPLILPDPFTKQLSFPLWAMRSIVKEWKHRMVDGSIKTLEAPLVSYRAPIVSFIRFTTQEKSKSEMLNSVISDSNHNHFFHRDCEGGNFNQVLGNGLVDMCWYLPAGKMDDRFPDLITFMNLHGNALEHPQQVAFLSKVSFMTFVLFTEEDVNEESTKVLQQLSTAPGGIVMLLCGRSTGKLKQLSKSIPKDKLQGLNLMQSARNADGIKKEIRERINAKLKKLWAAVSLESRKLEECVEVAVEHNIVVDERKKEFLQAQEMAHTLQKMLTSHTDEDISAKEEMLPLQGEHLWQKWAAQDKEEHRQVNRGGMRFEDYSSRKQKEKAQIRKLQLHHVEHLNPLMEKFIKFLLSTSGSVRNYFLQCLKLYLNDHSRNTIATWQKQYKELRSQLLALEKERKPSKGALHDIEILHKKIVNASLGLEHLLRELGQVYEAVQEAPRCTVEHKQAFSQLPKVAAELLIDGYPLELMDGDAAHVPKTWVSAVMEEMTKLLNNPRLFVLSVLGLQSTGKSTLINTTFGLQFNVGAGRCTRGAFMQLLPISAELTHETKCDYILIVDTEGLRAPELDYQKMQQHDNELATFVIGLANVTIINIYGETPGDMDDILQTSVHAFIRMKAVRMQFNPSCQFVHQNVAAVGASGKGGMGRAKFKDKLNRMTFEAAMEEKCEGIQYFSDVIRFDEDNDVHHFPGLWKGDPPMAPVNPGYSEKALSLKSHLVQSVQRSKGLQKLSDIHVQIEDLWNALLHEKFVFSFKNTLELSVYRSLETKYIQWAGRFRTKMLGWEQNARNEIKNSPPDQLKALEHKLLNVKLPAEVIELRNVLEAELSAYFEENDQREMLAQWQSETTNRLKRLERQLKDQAKDHCLELMSSQQARETINNMRTNYQEQLMKKVRSLVSSLPRKQLTDSDSNTQEQADKLRKTFHEQWAFWIQDLAKNAPVHREEIDVELSVQQSLIELYKSEEQHVREKLKSKPLSEWGKRLHLTLKEEHATIKVKESTYRITRKLREMKDMVLGKSGPEPAISNPAYKHQVELNTKAVFDTTEEYLRSIENENFHPSFTDELLGQIKKGIDEDDHTGFVYTKDYYLDLSLTVCGYAAKKFKRMRETFLKDNDPIEYLEREMKTPLFSLFKNQYLQIAGEKIAACTFCDLITGCIKKQVLDLLGSMIFEDMRTLPHLATKSALKARILIDLGEELQETGDTHDYFVHLNNVARSYRKWLTLYTKEYCRECKGGKQSRLVLLAHQKLNTLVRLVGKQVDEVTEENKHEDGIETKKWLSCICSQLASTLEMDVFSGFQDLGGVQRLKDAENFTEEIQKGLQVIQIHLQDSLSVLTLDDLKAKPYDLLYDLLSGCTEQCPFCNEQCDCTNDDHTVKHSVQQHRPMCLSGFHWDTTKEMITDMCNYSVGSDNRFKNKDTGNEWFPYKRFQEKYPKWSITVDMSAESSLYWKWFVGKHSGEIATYYGIKDNDIPREWKQYTWEEAREEVVKTYKV